MAPKAKNAVASRLRARVAARQKESASALVSKSPLELLHILADLATDPRQGQQGPFMSEVAGRLVSCGDAFAGTLPLEALSDPRLRSGLLKLLVYAIREATTRQHPSWVHWHCGLTPVMKLLHQALGRQRNSPDVLPLQLELVRLIVQADVLPSLSSLLASLPHDANAACSHTNALALSNKALGETVMFLSALLTLFGDRQRDGFVRQGLLEALRDSRLLELAARACVHRATITPAPALGAVGAPASGGPDRGSPGPAGRGDLMHSVFTLFLGVAFLDRCRSDPDRSVYFRALGLLLGPNLQHLLLVHLVSQLCAADGGPRYGLPPEVDLTVVSKGSDGAASSGASGSDAVGTAEGQRPLLARALILTVELWRGLLVNFGLGRPPVSDGAVRMLCARLADAANEVLEEELARKQPEAAARMRRGRSVQRPAGEGGAGDTLNEPGVRRLSRFSLRDCRPLAIKSLKCALATSRELPFRGTARLWAPIVRTVDVLVSLEGRDQLLGRLGPELRELMQPRIPFLTPDMALAPHPTPQVAAALEAGYVPCLERLLRHAYGGPGLSAATQGIQAAVDHFSPFISITGVLMYGEPRAAASLLATGAKLVRRAGSAIANLPPGAVPQAILPDFLRILKAACTFGGQEDRHWLIQTRFWWDLVIALWERDAPEGPEALWWLPEREEGGAPAQPAGPQGERPPESPCETMIGIAGALKAATASPGASSSSSGASSGASSSADVSSPAGRFLSTPVKRLLTLTSFSWARWLPVLIRASHAVRPAFYNPELQPAIIQAATDLAPAQHLASATLVFAPTVTAAYLTCAQRAAATGDPHLAEAAASWRQLLRDMDLFTVVRALLYDMGALTGMGLEPDPRKAAMAVSLLLYASVCLPEEAAAFMKAPLTLPAPGPQAPQLTDLTVPGFIYIMMDDADRNRYEKQLLALEVASSAKGAAQETLIALIEESEGDAMKAAKRLAELLPPPCVTAAALGLPACANVHCENLEGDSEAELGLSRCAGRCGGAASYCGRGCQEAHWKAGHKKECRKGASPPGAESDGVAEEEKESGGLSQGHGSCRAPAASGSVHGGFHGTAAKQPMAERTMEDAGRKKVLGLAGSMLP